MVRPNELPEPYGKNLAAYKCPAYETQPWVQGPPLRQRRVAIISTAGVHLRSGRPFGLGSGDYNVIPGDTDAKELLMSHVSANFDRHGFQQDWNVIFPPDRLQELESRGMTGSVWPMI